MTESMAEVLNRVSVRLSTIAATQRELQQEIRELYAILASLEVPESPEPLPVLGDAAVSNMDGYIEERGRTQHNLGRAGGWPGVGVGSNGIRGTVERESARSSPQSSMLARMIEQMGGEVVDVPIVTSTPRSQPNPIQQLWDHNIASDQSLLDSTLQRAARPVVEEAEDESRPLRFDFTDSPTVSNNDSDTSEE